MLFFCKQKAAYEMRISDWSSDVCTSDLRKYGITMSEFEAMLERQGRVCAICHGQPNGPGKRFHVDHCHNSSKVRGLLCGKCNTAIGLLNDDPQLAESAAAYLRI